MNKLNIISFKFDLNDRINILIPELTIDYYTEVEIQYIRDKKTFSIGSENIFAAISDLINATSRILKNDNRISNELLFEKGLSYHYNLLNLDVYREKGTPNWEKLDSISMYSIYLRESYLWLYEYKGDMYIEVGASLDASSSEDDPKKIKEYMLHLKNYKFSRVKLKRENIEIVNSQSKKLFNKIFSDSISPDEPI